MPTTFTPDEFEQSRPGPWRSFWSTKLSSADITMSADEQWAYHTGTTTGPWALAKSSQSGTGNVYVELTVGTGGNNIHLGVVNINAPTNNYVGATPNGLSISNNGNAYCNGVTLASPGFNFNANDTVAIAVYGPLQLIQFRNVTQNTAWSPLYSLVSVGRPPYLLAVSFDTTAGGSVFANFYGPFAGVMPTGSPAFTIWNAEALFSEQPVKIIDFDAILLDGSYTSANLNDLEAIPFVRIEWGDAVLDARNNLVFTDWVIGDHPLFSICITVTGGVPANNWLWAAWDYGTPFVFARVHIPNANMVAVSNIRIPPPPPLVSPPNVGQGRVLQIFSSCDTAQLFNWTNGHVFGTENVLVWEPIESATRPPSIIGRDATIIANTIQGGSWGPPIGPPL